MFECALLVLPSGLLYLFGLAYSVLLAFEPGRQGLLIALLIVGLFFYAGFRLLISALDGPDGLNGIDDWYWLLSGLAALASIVCVTYYFLDLELVDDEFLESLIYSFAFGVPLSITFVHCFYLRLSYTTK